MTLHHAIAWIFSNMRYRWATVAATSALLAMSMAVVLAVLTSPALLDFKAQADVGKVGLIVAGKGSALQWTMATLYHVDMPPSNVNAQTVFELLQKTEIQAHIASKVAIAMGDSVQGARLVGVDSLPVYFALFDSALDRGQLATQAMQAVVGAGVAKRLNLNVGSQFYSSHGMGLGGSSHDDEPYAVTGVLKPTGSVLDSLIITPIESVWLAHEGKPRDAQEAKILAESRDITAVLIQYRYPLSSIALPSLLEKAAADNITIAPVSQQVQRLWILFEPFFNVLMVLAVLISVSAAVAVILTARLTQAQRLRDLGVLRMLGANRRVLCLLLTFEVLGLWLCALGLLVTMAWLGTVLCAVMMNISIDLLLCFVWPNFLLSVIAALMLLLGCALITAYRLFSQSPADVLQVR
jgi:putative ABC transport system permease protein